jgi:hypothetical protein
VPLGIFPTQTRSADRVVEEVLSPSPESNRVIIIEPLEGLCNRMRTLDSAIAFSQNIQRPLKVIWRMDTRLHCPLSDLFEYTETFGQVVEHKYPGQFARLRRRARIASIQVTKGVYISQKKMEYFLAEQRSFEELKRFQTIYISTWKHFYPSNSLRRNFVPISPLLSEINAITKNGDDMIGVHIRRTDHGPSVERSPLWRFVELMEAEILLDPQVRFFLATDSPQDEALLQERFPDRIVSHPKTSLDRGNPHAIQDAVIDLYCLAACRKLIGSYWSSFSDLAWKLRDIDRVIVDVKNASLKI